MTATTSDSGGLWRVTLAAPRDVAVARQVATTAMTELGASVIKRTKFVTAVSEVARNALLHGGGGYIRFRIDGAGNRRQLVAECVDRGPGIADVDQAMKDGFSSGSGLGLGLGGASRLVESFEIVSTSGAGTTIRMKSGA